MNLIKIFHWLVIRPLSFGIEPTTALAGLSIASGLFGSRSSSRAARQQAAAMREATAEQRRQYEQSRQDLAPWMTVARGEPIYDTGGKITGYTGGTLEELAGYGRSQVDPSQYIPESNIPQYSGYVNQLPEVRSNIPQFQAGGDVSRFEDRGNIPQFQGRADIPEFDVRGDQPEFSPEQLDVYKDPGYEFRRGEMERQVDRAAAGQGKVLSGNRLEELMARGGEMASQEYGNMYQRAVQDYGIQRAREQEGYGRDVTRYGEQRAREQDLYGRDLTQYELDRARESAGYGRAESLYGKQRDVEQELYGRGLTAWEAKMKEDAARYGRDVDQYGRELGLANDLYRARAGEEQLGYGRGEAAYGRAYGQETDYLNRLAGLSQTGQTAATNIAQLGGQKASNIAQNIRGEGAAQAAGTLGQASAWQNTMGDLTSLYARGTRRPSGGSSGGLPRYNLDTSPSGWGNPNSGGYWGP